MHLSDLLNNHLIINSLAAWAVAQILKTIIYACAHREWDWERLFGDGGMPSGHSATVTSVAVMCALLCGTGSAAFAISAILALIVCHDASGVRQETGKQAIVINELVELFRSSLDKELQEIRLKEFVGHTRVQVLAGILVGAANAFLMHALFFS